jgi:hypothetical protein
VEDAGLTSPMPERETPRLPDAEVRNPKPVAVAAG